MEQNCQKNFSLMFLKRLAKYIILFIIFGAIYFCLECAWKGRITHWSMFILAGFIGVIIGGINEWIPWRTPFWLQCSMGMIISVLGEAITGLIVNVWLQLNIWHYNIMPFLWGQCSVPFALAWFFLAGVCIIIDDYIRWKWFKEEEPFYT